jgi:hypothetical protein
VLASDPKGSEQVEWGGVGDPGGTDYQFISADLAQSVSFIRAVGRGVLEIVPEESDPEVVEALQQQTEAFQKRMGASAAVAAESLERTENNDYLSIPCIGPNAKGGNCAVEVAVKASKKNDDPPLCPAHVNLRHEYVPEVHIEGDQNVTKWIRTTIGARERRTD